MNNLQFVLVNHENKLERGSALVFCTEWRNAGILFVQF